MNNEKYSEWKWQDSSLYHYSFEGAAKPFRDDDGDHPYGYHDYEIHVSEFRTGAHLAFWINHLSQSLWITKQGLRIIASELEARNHG